MVRKFWKGLCQISRKEVALLLALAGLLSSASPLFAQTYTINTADDLNNGIGSINSGAVPATLLFNTGSIDLAGLSAPPLGILTQNTALMDNTGGNLFTLTNSNLGAAVSLNSTHLLEVTPNYQFNLNGAGYLGQDGSGNGLPGNGAVLNSGSLQLDTNSALTVMGGNGDNGTTGDGGAGGAAAVSLGGSVTMASGVTFNVSGGFAGMGVTNVGDAGSATLITGGGVGVDSTNFSVVGGQGGSSEDARGGNGGNAWVSIGAGMTITSNVSNSVVSIIGGTSGTNGFGTDNGGNSGGASLIVGGPVSIDDSQFLVEGGFSQGGAGSAGTTEGSGGNAWVSMGNLYLTSAVNTTLNAGSVTYGDFNVLGANGGGDTGSALGGKGGSATLLGHAVSVDSSQVNISGGGAGSGMGQDGQTEMAGGDVAVSIASLNLTSASQASSQLGSYSVWAVAGGSGGNDNGAAMGGNGGSAKFSVAGAVSMDSSNVTISGGSAGSGSESVTTETEGNGGDAAVSLGSLTMSANAAGQNGVTTTTFSFAVMGGAGGSDNLNGNGGNGGNAVLSAAGHLSGDSTNLIVSGGTGGFATNSNGGNGGNGVLNAGGGITETSSYQYSTWTVQGGQSGTPNSSTGLVGNGGAASLFAAGPVSLDTAVLNIEGAGNFMNGNGAAGQVEGSGGAAWASIGSLSMTDNTVAFQFNGSGLNVLGGTGGSDNSNAAGGNGGDATLLISGTVTQSGTAINVTGGTGGNSGSSSVTANGGNGGNASALIAGGVTLTTTNEFNSSIQVAGGGGGFNNLIGGMGQNGTNGAATLSVGGPISVDSSFINVVGGSGGYSSGSAGTTEAAGGAAWVSTGGVILTSNAFNNNFYGVTSALDVQGGNGSNDDNLGTGGNGGNATYLASGPISLDSSSINIQGGNGGEGLSAGGGAGGDAVFAGGAVTLTSTSTFTVQGGAGASILGGNGGSVTATMTSLDLANFGADFTAQGGQAGGGAVTGSAYVSIGTLRGAGQLAVIGDSGSSELQVANCDFTGIIAGNTGLDLVGGGTQILAGANTYSGGTTLESGTLYLDNNSAVGTGTLVMGTGTYLETGVAGLSLSNAVSLEGGSLLFLNSAAATLSGVISGAGGFNLIDNGSGDVLDLAGDSTYSGGTAITSGTLVLGNAHAVGTGNLGVNGGTLELNGATTVAIGGTYTQASSGTLLMGLGPSTGDLGSLNVTGAANLNGTLKLAPTGGVKFLYGFNQDFTIVDASSVSGTFSTLVDSIPDSSYTLTYNSTNVVLNLTTPTFQQMGGTSNEKNIGLGIDGFSKQSPNASLITYLENQAPSAMPAIYDQISPESLTPLYQIGFATAQIEGSLALNRLSQIFGTMGAMNRDTAWNGEGPMFAADLPAGQEAAMSQSLQPNRWGGFVNLLSSFGTVTADSNAQGYQYSIGGMAMGLDYRFAKDLVMGLLLGYSSSGTSLSSGTVGVTGGQAGIYAGWQADALHIEAMGEGGQNTYTSQRNALQGIATGNSKGWQFTGGLSGGYDFNLDNTKLGPFVSGQYTGVYVDSFTETGSLAPLTYGAQNENYLSSDLGASASHNLDMGGGFILVPTVSAAWEHTYQGNEDSLNASLGNGGGFSVNGPALGADSLVLGAVVNAQLDKDFHIFAQYQGKIGLTNYTEQNFSGGVNIGL